MQQQSSQVRRALGSGFLGSERTRRRILRCAMAATVLACASGASPAFAYAYVATYINDSTNNSQNQVATDPTAASLVFAALGGSGAGSANVATGVLTAASSSPPAGGSESYALTTAYVYDFVTFSASSGTAYLDMHWSGSLDAVDGSFAELNATIFGGSSDSFVLEAGSSCTTSATVTCGTTIDRTISIPLDLADLVGGRTVELVLSSYPDNGGGGDFSASFALRLPDGVTYTSGSGVFLADAIPIVGAPTATVPEPAALFPLGLGMLAFVSRRRRGDPVGA